MTTGDKSSVTVPTAGATCSTSCANSDGFCPSTYTTISSYLAQTAGALCISAANSGAAQLTLQFAANIGATASCSTLCSAALNGSCDGNGWGASDGSTVADYLRTVFNASGTCTSSTKTVSDTAAMTIPSSQTNSACTTAASPVFIAGDSPHPASVAVTYVAGDVNHLAADFITSISQQSTAVFGANNPVAMAVITQLPGDNLIGTDVGTDYIHLANAMNSSQISSINADYAQSLAAISNYIVTSTQNNFLLPVPPGGTILSVNVVHSG